MKKKIMKRIVTSIIIGTNILLLASCGSAKNSDSQKIESQTTTEATSDMSMADTATSTAEASKAGLESAQGITSNNLSEVSGQKLIKDVNLSVETKEFDAFLIEINNQIASVGGYVQNSDVSGGSYQYNNYRYGNIVARIPADKLNGFVQIIDEKGNVIQKSEMTTDVTLQYVDMESHIKALKIEQETLLGLLENATKMEDVIAIQSQLTQVRYEIESNESQIRTYDNLVNYSTVTINISEVERETDAEATSFVDEIRIKLGYNLYAIQQGSRSFLINVIAAIPYIIILALVIFAITMVGRKCYKKFYKKTNKVNEKANNAEADQKEEANNAEADQKEEANNAEVDQEEENNN